MTTTTTNLTVRIDKELKNQVETLFDELGMSVSTAVNIFFKKCLREDRIPFEISRSSENFNKETIAAMIEAEHIANDPNAKGYHNIDELFAALEADDEE